MATPPGEVAKSGDVRLAWGDAWRNFGWGRGKSPGCALGEFWLLPPLGQLAQLEQIFGATGRAGLSLGRLRDAACLHRSAGCPVDAVLRRRLPIVLPARSRQQGGRRRDDARAAVLAAVRNRVGASTSRRSSTPTLSSASPSSTTAKPRSPPQTYSPTDRSSRRRCRSVIHLTPSHGDLCFSAFIRWTAKQGKERSL